MGNDTFFALCKREVVEYFNQRFLTVCIMKSRMTATNSKHMWTSTRNGKTIRSLFKLSRVFHL